MTHLTVQQLSASLDGALAGPSLELVARHLAACHDCRDRQARLAKHDDALRRLLGQEPGDLFLDDLTRRAEELVTAVARGMPAPAMVTSVPLLHEEDPYAPAEPPPLPPRPELGRFGEMAQEAGWGRIGVKPAGSAHAPQSDPDEAQRMLDALARGGIDAFTELDPLEPHDRVQLEAPLFDRTAWVNDPGRRDGEPPERAREAPSLDLFFEELDNFAPGMWREGANQASRHDQASDPSPFQEGALPPERLAYELPDIEPVPLDHAPYAPPGWGRQPPPREHSPGVPSEREPAPPQAALTAYTPSEWTVEPTSPPDPNELSWSAPRLEPVMLDLGAYARPIAQRLPDRPPPHRAAPRRRAARQGPDRALVLAIVSVAGLLLVLLALQLLPASRSTVPTIARLLHPVKRPTRQRPQHESRPPGAEHVRPRVHGELARPPLDPLLPPLAPPEAGTATSSLATQAPAEGSGATAPPSGGSPAPGDARPSPSGADDTGDPATSAPAQSAHATPATAAPARAAHAVVTKPRPDPKPAAAVDAEWPLLCGEVDDPEGQPVVGARVSIAEIAVATRTDAHGRFCMSAPPGARNLFVEASGFTPQSAPANFSSTSPDLRVRLEAAR